MNLRYTPMTNRWDPFAEMAQFQNTMNRLLGTANGSAAAYPPLNIYASENEAVVSAELPGIEADKVDISVNGRTFTLSGQRDAGKDEENANYHRQERFTGHFSRTVELPFAVDNDKVKAQLHHGILRVILPRAENDRRRKIAIENK